MRPAVPARVSELQGVSHRVPSPDGRWCAVTHDEWEYRMGWSSARIVLADAAGRIVETFGGRLAETTHAPVWSQDSAWLAFAVRAGAGFAYVIWHVETARFGLIGIGNPYPLEVSFDGSHALRVALRRDQVEAANSDAVFGGGRSEAPVRRFVAAAPANVDPASLLLHPRAALDRLDEVAAASAALDIGLVPDGFHPYDGPGLQGTRQKINGRPLEGHHLEAFADHGDPVARAWLDELKQRTGDGYDPWARVAKVLGTRKR